ncbi:protein INCA1 isoform X1 [Aquarana catesbeiana]|uniref:protein INCA1 isoform X1 n=1 Tax=Aquarana catesbeiana TaxID=8400 RepID=UPI003CC9EFAA
MYDESSGEDCVPFIRHSRIVKRFNLQPLAPPSSSSLPLEERYGPEFWDRLMRQPSVDVSGVPGMKSGYPAWRENYDYPSLPVPSLESLPSPSELCRSKKRKKSESGYDRREMSVQHHIQELKRKQSSIDQLKSMTWGSRSIPELEGKEEMRMELTSVEPRQETFADFFEMCQSGTQDSPFLDLSPQNSTSGVVFPWMTPRDDFSFCVLDHSGEGWRGVGNIFFQE